MDIAFMKVNLNISNSSTATEFNFISENTEIAIPYLILLSIFTLNGCIGNSMVIAAVVNYKVNAGIRNFLPLFWHIRVHIDQMYQMLQKVTNLIG